MDSWIMLGIIMFIFIILMSINKKVLENKNKVKDKEISYNYTKRDCVMTAAEQKFFNKLQEAVKDEYLIFPQIHLSSLLNHNIKGQSWKGAFNHINGKSVDYVLSDKNNLKTKFVIELDDNSHNKEDRQKRDKIVENIFQKAEITLVRFINLNDLSPELIRKTLKEASAEQSKENLNENPNKNINIDTSVNLEQI